jgi:excisionase family DNA binding protein
MRTINEDRLLDAEAAAQVLSVRPSTIRDWWRTGKLQRVKIGRLTRVWESELLALIPREHNITSLEGEQ